MNITEQIRRIAGQIFARELEAASSEAGQERQQVIADASRRNILNSGIYFSNLLAVQKRWLRRICEARVQSYLQVLKEAGLKVVEDDVEAIMLEVQDLAERNAQNLAHQINQEVRRRTSPISDNWAKNNFDRERDIVVSQIRRNLLIEQGIQSLRGSAQAPAGGHVFVVMGFHKELDVIYEEAILPAIKHFGLEPFRVDKEEFNETITQEILEKLRSCNFVVADLTYERPNCYYELGYAVGHQKRFVICAREDHDPRRPLRNPDDPKVHFDLDSHKITYWRADALGELRKILIERIGKIKNQTAAERSASS